LSYVSRRKLQSTATPDADKLLRKVLLRNSISRVDLALAEAHSTPSVASPQSNGSSTATLSSPLPIQVHPDPERHDLACPSSSNTPLRADEDEFVFPDATSLNTPRVYSTADADAEARWLDSLLEDMSDDDGDYEEATEENVTHGDDEEEEDEEGYYLESLAWLLDEPEPIISVPAPISPQEPLVLEVRPFDYPLPDDSDDDLSTAPDMEEDEGESEADSGEWPLTPGQRSMTSMLGRSITASTLNQLVASGDGMAPLPLPSIAEGPAFDADVRPAIHEDEPPLYRYSPAPGERPIATSTTALTNSAC
jgi:hypothetical protein